MKQIWRVIMLAAIAGNIAFANDAGFTGEWIVESDNDSDSGIVVTIDEPPKLPAGVTQVFTDGSVFITGKGRVILPKVQHAFTVIPAGTFFDFIVNGTELTGSIIRQKTEKPILNGRINGNRITFTVRETLRDNTYTYSYTGNLLNDSIQFEVRPPSNGGKPFKFTAKRLMPE